MLVWMMKKEYNAFSSTKNAFLWSLCIDIYDDKKHNSFLAQIWITQSMQFYKFPLPWLQNTYLNTTGYYCFFMVNCLRAQSIERWYSRRAVKPFYCHNTMFCHFLNNFLYLKTIFASFIGSYNKPKFIHSYNRPEEDTFKYWNILSFKT